MPELTPRDRGDIEIRRRPFDFFNVENFFENFLAEPFVSPFYPNRGQMRVDIKENDKEYIVEAELPGVRKDEINIDLRDNRLTISVERDEETREEKDNYIRRERRFGSMARSFYVDNIVDDKIDAKFENGVLTIVLPKKEEGVERGRRIQIH